MNTTEILNKLGITQLNEMQEQTISAIANGSNDVVVLSPTGTGKTLAYLLPLVDRMLSNGIQDTSRLSLVVVVPTRELALQSLQVFKSMGTSLRAMALYGGRPTMDEHIKLRAVMPHVVFATPGRLNDHIAKDNISVADIQTLVIDEFDKCLEMGFQNEMNVLLGNLVELKQRILLSATHSEGIPYFVRMSHTKTVDFRQEEQQTSSRLDIYKVESQTKDKLPTLSSLLLSFGQQSTVVFLNHRDAVERTAQYLMQQGFVVSLMHGGLEQRQREDALYKFANGSATVLVATDLASRGLDIPDIKNIVHYHLPETSSNYIHRVGRTARWNSTGRTFFLLNPEEDIPEYVEGEVKDYIPAETNTTPPQPKMVTLYIGKGKKDKLSKGDIVGFLCKIGGLQSSEIGIITVKERYTYVAISLQRLKQVLVKTKEQKIKGMKTIVEEVE
jgi:superfamily II DNA/RNA helicase